MYIYFHTSEIHRSFHYEYLQWCIHLLLGTIGWTLLSSLQAVCSNSKFINLVKVLKLEDCYSAMSWWCTPFSKGYNSFHSSGVAFDWKETVFNGIEVRALSRSMEFLHTKHKPTWKPFVTGLHIVHSGTVMMEQETKLFIMAIFGLALTLTATNINNLTGTKACSLNTEKQSQNIFLSPPTFTVCAIYSW